ncbi:MAG: recombination mediator RecR [Patescibacteria group bacterium]
MTTYPDQIKKCIDLFTKLPGLGPKSAERIVFHLLKDDSELSGQLMQAISELKKKVVTCQRCFNVAMASPCQLCADQKRDQSTVCVVAGPPDVLAIEKTGEYHGLYHVLGGVLNPSDGITPDRLRIPELLKRLNTRPQGVKEVIIATNPDLEGESTAMYLARQLHGLPVKVTRLAKGLPMGSDLEYADEITITSALKGRQQV